MYLLDRFLDTFIYAFIRLTFGGKLRRQFISIQSHLRCMYHLHLFFLMKITNLQGGQHLCHIHWKLINIDNDP